MKTLILDYQCGNIGCVKNIFNYLNCEVKVLSLKSYKIIKPNEFDLVVLPGVGNFQHASNYLHKFVNLNEFKKWLSQNKIVICICLGFQLLFGESEEKNDLKSNNKGLGIIKGNVVSLSDNENLSLNIGWCQSRFKKLNTSNLDLEENLNQHYFYHMHSFGIKSNSLKNDKNLKWITESKHNASGIKFISALRYDNIYAFQFHPEKSGNNGLNLLKNIVNDG